MLLTLIIYGFLIFVVFFVVFYFVLESIDDYTTERNKRKYELYTIEDKKKQDVIRKKFITEFKSEVNDEYVTEKNAKDVAKVISVHRQSNDVCFTYFDIYNLFKGKDKRKRIYGGLYKILTEYNIEWKASIYDTDISFSKWKLGASRIAL